jgi:hypothetical protein
MLGPTHGPCAPLGPRVVSRHEPSCVHGTHTGPQGPRGLCAVAGLRSLHAEMKPTGRALTIFAKYGGGVHDILEGMCELLHAQA